MDISIYCPKCRSNQISADKKGFSGRKAVAGIVLTGGIGVLAGTVGSNTIIITCLNCGNRFKPGHGGAYKQPIVKAHWNKEPIDYTKRKKANRIIARILFLPLWFFCIVLFFSDLYIASILLGIGAILFTAMSFVKINI